MITVADPFFGRLLERLTAPGAGYSPSEHAVPSPGTQLDLGVGEARYPLPARLRTQIGHTAATLDEIWYSSPGGEALLQTAYLDHLFRTMNTDRGSDAVLVTAGGKEAAWLAIRYLLHRHSIRAALVPSPGWEPYSLWLDAAACTKVLYDPLTLAEDPTSLRGLVADAPIAPSLLIVNYPHNPTGVQTTQHQMDQILAMAAELGLAVVSDEVYRAFADGDVSAVFAPARDPRRHLVVDSCSKALTVAGLRVGFLVADPAVVRELTAFRSAYASCTSVLNQQIAALLLTSDDARAWLAETRSAVERDRCAVVDALIGYGIAVRSHGGLYIWCRTPDTDDLPVVFPTGLQRARFTSGAGFGAADHFRLCTARTGLDPMEAAAAVVTTLRGR